MDGRDEDKKCEKRREAKIEKEMRQETREDEGRGTTRMKLDGM